MNKAVLSLVIAAAILLNIQPARSEVGRTPGEFSVTATGSATYSIPVWSPPGPRNVQPKISLVYNSSSGNGPIGVGWKISGITAINRCNKTVAQDADASEVKLGVTDGYCFNGNRLRLTSGMYGVSGSTYQTERADFSLITANGTQGNGPSYFTVKDRNGVTYEYGSDGNSKVIPSGSSTASTWMLRQVSDPVGNRMRITYAAPTTGLTGTTHPEFVEWTATSSGASTFLYRMSFEYSNNVAASSPNGYVAGTLVSNQKLLTSISITNGSSLVRKYFLTYNTSPTTGAYRLWKVTECSEDNISGPSCLLPTVIGYQDGVAGISTPSTSIPSSANSRTWAADLNGDGFDDILFLSGTSLYASFGSASGLSSPSATGITATSANVLVGDVRGIGRDSILVPVSGTWMDYTWNGSGFPGSSTGTSVGSVSGTALLDGDGDGRLDIFTFDSAYVVKFRLSTSTPTTTSFSTTLTTAMDVGSMAPYKTVRFPASSRRQHRYDFNGDGRDDLWFTNEFPENCHEHDEYGNQICYDMSIYVYAMLSQGSGPATYQYLASGTSSIFGPIIYAPSVTPANVNDDACTDVLHGQNYAVMSSCNSTAGVGVSLGGAARVFVDWDGDGRQDVLTHVSGPTLSVRVSTGNGYTSAVSTSITPTGGEWLVGDFDGDGLDDLANRSASAITYGLHNGAGIKPDLATSFTDGYGVTHTASYTQTTRGNHTLQVDAISPNHDFARPLHVVSTSTHSDGIAGIYTRSYWYSGAAWNREGRGFAGFASRRATDSRTGAYTIEYYERSFPQTGAVVKEEAYQAGGTLVSRKVTSLSTNTLESAPNNQRYFVYPLSIETTTNEVGGVYDGLQSLHEYEVRTYDIWGNATTITRTKTDKDAYSPFYNHSWTESRSLIIYPDTSGNWCLGLPSSSTTISTTTTGESGVTRSTTYTPDYSHCRISAEYIEPSSSTRRVDVEYSFDAFGNVNAVAVTGRNSNGTTMGTRTSYLNWGTAGQLPVSETNALGQVTTRTFHATFGSLLTEVDPNGIVLESNTYDALGRLTRTLRADGTGTRYTYADCSLYACENGDPGSVSTGINRMLVIISERDASDVQIRESRVHLDQFDRIIVAKDQTMSGAFSRTGTQYDEMGRIHRQTVPCAAASCVPHWVTNTHDLLGRLVTQSRPQGESVPTPVVTSYGYAGRTQMVTDPQSKLTARIVDVNGWMRRSQDHDGYYQGFGYDAAGSLTQVTDSLSNILFTASYSYGIEAFQDSSTDMDLGVRQYSRNSLGELTAGLDAKGQTFSQTFDVLSRLTARTEAEGTTTYVWGTSAAAKNIGRLASVSMSGYSESIAYDGVGRPSTRSIAMDQNYEVEYSYNNQGAIDVLTWPTSTSSARVKVKYGYAYGALQSVTDWTSGSAGTVYWVANSRNPRSQITQETLGNGVVTNRAFDAVTGWLGGIQSGLGGGAALQNHSYLYDLVGNLTQRQENTLGLTENFYYDNLYRLDYSQLGGVTNLDLSYDAMGNITARSDVGGGAAWTYHATKKHAVTVAGANSYSYDANGNVSNRNGFAIGWTSYNYPSSVANSTESTTFYYGPDRQYYRQVYSGPSGVEETYYVGDLLEKVIFSGGTDWRHYVRVGGQIVAVISRQSGGTNSVHYQLADHLGSGSTLTNSSGVSLVRQSYGAYGLPRDGASWAGSVSSGDQAIIDGISRRGYTGHSMLGQMGLIHMNGRIQDSVTGRFLSPDPTVPNPEFTQSFNRYSYVNNNPLTYLDPSGFTEELAEVVVNGSIINAYPVFRDYCWGICYVWDDISLLDGSGLDMFQSAMRSRSRSSSSGAASQPLELDEVVVTNTRLPQEEKKPQRLPMVDLATGIPTENLDDFNKGMSESLSWCVDLCTGVGGLVKAGVVVLAKKAIAKVAAKSATGAGKPFTRATKRDILEANRQKNGGVLRSDKSGEVLTPAKQSKRGVTPPRNEAQVDHIYPRSRGGTNDPSNAQVLSRGENIEKSDSFP